MSLFRQRKRKRFGKRGCICIRSAEADLPIVPERLRRSIEDGSFFFTKNPRQEQADLST